MPINITGEFQPSDGVHGFDLYDPQDIKAGNINVVLQAIANGAFKGGSHATAPAGEIVAQVKTSTGVPTHSASEGTICWNSVDDTFYVNNNGTTGWTAIGAGGSPGGANKQIQFNNSSVFGGVPGFEWDGTNLTLAETIKLLLRNGNVALSTPLDGVGRLTGSVGLIFDGDEIDFLGSGGVLPLLQLLLTASAVNYLQIRSSATGNPLLINALGTDENISINLVPKGLGRLQANGYNVPTLDEVIAMAVAL